MSKKPTERRYGFAFSETDGDDLIIVGHSTGGARATIRVPAGAIKYLIRTAKQAGVNYHAKCIRIHTGSINYINAPVQESKP